MYYTIAYVIKLSSILINFYFAQLYSLQSINWVVTSYRLVLMKPTDRLDAILDHHAETRPQEIAIVDAGQRQQKPISLSYLALQEITFKLAYGMKEMGVREGDIVSMQLPNWWEFIAVVVACNRLGAAFNPLMPIFRKRELSYMLNYLNSSVLFTPRRFRDFDYEAMASELTILTPRLENRILVADSDTDQVVDGFQIFSDLIKQPAEHDNHTSRQNCETAMYLFTSGTTGEPKCAQHTWQGLLSQVPALGKAYEIDSNTVVLNPMPLAHMAGFVYGVLLPLYYGCSVVLMDVWDAKHAAKLIIKYSASLSFGPPTMISDLINLKELVNGDMDLTSMKSFACGGAQVLPSLIQQAKERSINVLPMWGMTEVGVGSATTHQDKESKRISTVGRPLTNLEARIVDENRNVIPPGHTGELEIRGKGRMEGYLGKESLNGFDENGWFPTGDLAAIDNEGYISIEGRLKDIIIRGGENIPVAEIENIIYAHASVDDVAIVAKSDERMGEKAVAFVILKPDARFSINDMQSWLEINDTAKQYWPEFLEILNKFPRTPSGKIQKHLLREMCK